MIYQVIKIAFNQKINNSYSNNRKTKEDGKNSIMVDTFLTIRCKTINKLHQLQNISANHSICLSLKKPLLWTTRMWLAK